MSKINDSSIEKFVKNVYKLLSAVDKDLANDIEEM